VYDAGHRFRTFVVTSRTTDGLHARTQELAMSIESSLLCR